MTYVMKVYDLFLQVTWIWYSHRSCSIKKVFLKISQNSQENACDRVPFLIKLQNEACNFIKKEALPQVFSCKFCKIFKNTLFTPASDCFWWIWVQFGPNEFTVGIIWLPLFWPKWNFQVNDNFMNDFNWNYFFNLYWCSRLVDLWGIGNCSK